MVFLEVADQAFKPVTVGRDGVLAEKGDVFSAGEVDTTLPGQPMIETAPGNFVQANRELAGNISSVVLRSGINDDDFECKRAVLVENGPQALAKLIARVQCRDDDRSDRLHMADRSVALP
jgi:hypothetical protein